MAVCTCTVHVKFNVSLQTRSDTMLLNVAWLILVITCNE